MNMQIRAYMRFDSLIFTTIKFSSVRMFIEDEEELLPADARQKRVVSASAAGETTIVDTLLFLVAWANYSTVGRKTEKRERVH